MKTFVTFIVIVWIGVCLGASREDLFPYGDENADQKLRSDADDISSPEFQLSVPIIFYDTIYKSLFVNDNGIISFLTEVPAFFNSQFPLSYPIIAAMYSDVDARGSGSVYYRETKDEPLLQRATADIVRHFSKAQQFKAQSLFIVTWDSVGRYNQNKTLTNTAQIVVATDGIESFAYLIYPTNGIQWIQGEGKISNLPDARTQAGFMSGDGRVHTLKGSGTEQIRTFDRMSNIYRPGVWLFFIGNLGGANIVEPDIDGDKRLAKPESETCQTAQLPCPPNAQCTDHSNGFCCHCLDGYFGNGRQCLANNTPLRMNGKVNGKINDMVIDGVDLHAYIVADEGRTYTAISRIPNQVGFDLQTLFTLGSVMGWLFASTKSGAPNGFTITGGIFNRSVDVDFPQTGHRIHIEEQFLGPDVFNFLKVELQVRGSLPSVPSQSKVQVDDFTEEYRRVSPGVIRSHASHSFKFGENSLNIPVIIDQTINYEECGFAPVDDEQSAIQLTIARNFIVYDPNEQIVRYASTSKSSFLSADDPCRAGNAQCLAHSSCVADGLSFKCICDRGYQSQYNTDSQNDVQVSNCVDIDECSSTRPYGCHSFADCINTEGSYMCRCKAGYTGDGYQCHSEQSCDSLITCGPNAQCVHLDNRTPECQCKNGFVGNGRQCTRAESETEDCRTYNICDVNAECLVNPLTQRHQCNCKTGFNGNGIMCIDESQSCELLNNCGINAECISDEGSNNAYYCSCNEGYVGDGYKCYKGLATDQSCNQINNCHTNAKCIYDTRSTQYSCLCDEGFVGNGYQCTRSSGEVSCTPQTNVCSRDGQCVMDSVAETGICKCNSGFVGDGTVCYRDDADQQCNTRRDMCDQNARCLYNSYTNRYDCQCNEGYTSDGKYCTAKADATCEVLHNCHPNATCAYDLNVQKYTCQCNTGFKGDGKQCKQMILSCNIVNNCDVKAECKYNFDAQAYRCECSTGFVGDGFGCRPSRTCREDQGVCDRNADCVYVEQLLTHVCRCRYGFVGDGFECSVAPRHDGDYFIFSQGMSLLRIPLQPTKEDKGKLLLTKPHQIPAGLDVDCLDGLVYWSDVAHGVIYKALYNGSSTQTVIEGLSGSPEGIAIDWVSRNIYWTDSLKDTIEVSRLDGKMHKTIINEGLNDPRGIVVHPGSGKMYWCDWSRTAPKIEAANLDGTGRTVLVSTDLGLPNNLAIDFDRNDLCWTDAGLHRIECVDLYSNSRRIVHTPTAYPFDLAIVGNNIYWTDWEIKFIQKVDRKGGNPDPMELPLGGNGRLYSIVTVPRHCPRITNACSMNNGGCRHLCLPNARGRTCVCPDTGGDDSCNQLIPK